MEIMTTYKRHTPTTVCGDSISVTTVYSSFDKSEIDELEEALKQTVGTVLVSHFPKEEECSK